MYFIQQYQVVRNSLITALEQVGMPMKIVNLVKMTIKNTKAVVLTCAGDIDKFDINREVRMGDLLSATLFNISFGHEIRNINK